MSERVEEVGSSQAASKGGNVLTPLVDGIVRIGVGVIFHLYVLKPPLPTQNASGKVHRANTKEQMSLDLDDL